MDTYLDTTHKRIPVGGPHHISIRARDAKHVLISLMSQFSAIEGAANERDFNYGGCVIFKLIVLFR